LIYEPIKIIIFIFENLLVHTLWSVFVWCKIAEWLCGAVSSWFDRVALVRVLLDADFYFKFIYYLNVTNTETTVVLRTYRAAIKTSE
jgi:hypothetical protein